MQDTGKNIVITALSAITPVGANAKMTDAAIRADVSGVSENLIYQCLAANPSDLEPPPFYAASVPLLDTTTPGVERITSLAMLALQQLQTQARRLFESSYNIGIMLALPNDDEALHHWQIKHAMERSLQSNALFSTATVCRIAQLGQIGVFKLIHEATALLQTGQIDCCIVGGIDTWLDPQRLAMLDQQGLLKSERNPDGFIPGEASGMLVLETETHALQHNHNILARLGSMGQGLENNDSASGKFSTGTGLATAITGAINGEDAIAFDGVYCDLNGESYRAFEWGLMLSRLGTNFDSLSTLVHPAEACGDVGAASGSMLLICAAQAVAAGKHADKPVLAWLASPGPERMALTLGRYQ